MFTFQFNYPESFAAARYVVGVGVNLSPPVIAAQRFSVGLHFVTVAGQSVNAIVVFVTLHHRVMLAEPSFFFIWNPNWNSANLYWIASGNSQFGSFRADCPQCAGMSGLSF